MKKYVSVLAALGAALAMATAIPAADAGPRHHSNGRHFSHNGDHGGHYGRGHRRGGYWHNGRWIALGVGAAIAAGAAGAYDDCYWRHGRRYCY